MKRAIAAAWIAWAALSATVARAAPPAAGGVVALFPEPARVVADYRDDAERYAALTVLYNALGESTKGTHTPGAYDRMSAYFRAFGEVEYAVEKRGRSSPGFKEFGEKAGRLLRDASFRESVLARYGLKTLPRAEKPAAPLFPDGGDPSDDAIKAAFLQASVVWIAAIVAMFVLASAMMRGSGCALARIGPPTHLPDSVRIVSVPGRTYEIAIESGLVVHKETTTETSVHTSTTGGQVHVQGNEVYTTPGQTHTSVSSVQKDVLWIRTPGGIETTWTFRGGRFHVREGQFVSRVVRPEPDGSFALLYAYNHATDQLEPLPGLHTAHASRALGAWLLNTFLGSFPGAFGLGMMFHRLGGMRPAPLVVQLATLWIMGGIGSAAAAGLVVNRLSKKIFKRRAAHFESRWVPELRRTLAASTPALTPPPL